MRSFVYNYLVELENKTIILDKVYLIEDEDFIDLNLDTVTGLTEDNKRILAIQVLENYNNCGNIFQACIEDNNNKRCDISESNIATIDIADNKHKIMVKNNTYSLVIKNCKFLTQLNCNDNGLTLLPYNIFIINCPRLNIYNVDKINATLKSRKPEPDYSDYLNAYRLKIPEIFINGKTSNIYKRIDKIEDNLKLLLNINKEIKEDNTNKDAIISELILRLDNITKQLDNSYIDKIEL
jgi:hypothetical protein